MSVPRRYCPWAMPNSDLEHNQASVASGSFFAPPFIRFLSLEYYSPLLCPMATPLSFTVTL